MSISSLIFITVSSILLALLEIQIEGEHGWAQNLPTWKIKNPLRKFITWPYITGYHIYLWLFLALLFQLPFFFNATFTIKNELLVLELLYLLLILEDAFWFLLNPKWGIKRFLSDDIRWHAKKLLFLPMNYWTSFIILVIIDFARRIL